MVDVDVYWEMGRGTTTTRQNTADQLILGRGHLRCAQVSEHRLRIWYSRGLDTMSSGVSLVS